MNIQVEALLVATAANILGFKLTHSDDPSIYTGDFPDVQWEGPERTLYVHPDKVMLGAYLHELGHVVTSTPKELASVNYEGGDRKPDVKEVKACDLQRYVFNTYPELFEKVYRLRTASEYGFDLDTPDLPGRVPPAFGRLFNHPEMVAVMDQIRAAWGPEFS